MWVLVGITKGIVGLYYGPKTGIKMKLLILTSMAATPSIWLIGNRKIRSKLRSRLFYD